MRLHEWTIANKLTVKPSKSSVLIIPPKQTISIPNIEIQYNHTKIVVKECIKYLEIEIDSRLSFQVQLKAVVKNVVVKELSRSVGIMF